MKLFETLSEYGHEQIVFWSEPELGYRGIIAIHDSTLGPALGGTRFWNYASDEEAITDVLAPLAGDDLQGRRGRGRPRGREVRDHRRQPDP
jgi:leucine dehydrogenase